MLLIVCVVTILNSLESLENLWNGKMVGKCPKIHKECEKEVILGNVWEQFTSG